MHRRLLFFLFLLLANQALAVPGSKPLRFCVADLPPISYRGPFGYAQGVLNRLIDRLLLASSLQATREFRPNRELLRGMLDGSCDVGATIANGYLEDENLRSWPLMEMTLVLIPGIFDRPPAGRLIPAGRYASTRFSTLDENWSEAIAGFERVQVDSYDEAWYLLQEGQIDGIVGVRETLAWHALDSGTFSIFEDFEIPVGQRKLNLYLSAEVDEDVAETIDEALSALDLQKLVWDMERTRSF